MLPLRIGIMFKLLEYSVLKSETCELLRFLFSMAASKSIFRLFKLFENVNLLT